LKTLSGPERMIEPLEFTPRFFQCFTGLTITILHAADVS
jgi:hypothetical protein